MRISKIKKGIATVLCLALVAITVYNSQLSNVLAANAADISLLGAVKYTGDEEHKPENIGVDYTIYNNPECTDSTGIAGQVPIAEDGNVSGSISNLDEYSNKYIKFDFRFGGIEYVKATVNNIDIKENASANNAYSMKIPDEKNIVFDIEFKNSNNTPPGAYDGIAYFIWQGENDELYFHKITGLEESATGNEEAYNIINIPVSDVKDDNTDEQFVISNRNYYWAWSSVTEILPDYSTFSGLQADVEDREKEEEIKRKYFIDPCGAEDGENTICTNGDREFRATIYDAAKYEGIAFSKDKSAYTYFPEFWDPTVFSNTVDISNTTAENPAVYKSFLIEPQLHFGQAAGSASNITDIAAVGVPEGAVTITGDATNGFDIKFASNFYDNVTFEITTTTGKNYVKIARTAIRVTDDHNDGATTVNAQLYYDDNESYSDYDMYATICYKDGSKSIKKVASSEFQTNPLNGDPLPAGTYELPGGQGLKSALFSVEVSDDVEGVAFNAMKAGALSGNTFGGSYLGSGIGAYFDIEARRVIY